MSLYIGIFIIGANQSNSNAIKKRITHKQTGNALFLSQQSNLIKMNLWIFIIFHSFIAKKYPEPLKAILELMVPVVGLEPTRHCWQRILSPSRLPFHHTGKLLIYYTPLFQKLQEVFAHFLKFLYRQSFQSKKNSVFRESCLFGCNRPACLGWGWNNQKKEGLPWHVRKRKA